MLVAAAAAASSVIQSDTVQKIGDTIAGIFGDTKAERARIARINALEQRALAGDDGAILALCYEAYEPRRGLPGDPRTPIDGKRSPEDVRVDARRTLQRIAVARGGTLPAVAAQWAEALKVPVADPRPSLGETLIDTVRGGVIEGTKQAAGPALSTEFRSQLDRYVPWIVGGVVIAVVGVVAFRGRK